MDSPGPTRENFSPQTQVQEPFSPSTDEWTNSPRKRTQTLPTFNCPLTGMAAKATALNRWSRIQEGVEEKGGTLSEDIFKILDLRTSGSFFGGSHTSNKEEENKTTARRGSDNTGSTAGTQKPDIDSQVLSHHESADSLTVSTNQQGNCKTEQKKDPQELMNR